MERIYSSRWFHPAAAVIIAASVLIVYSGTFHAAFQFDDIPQIVENDSLKDLSNIKTLLVQNRGVSMASFALNYAWGGLDVTGYHAVTVAVHLLASVLAYFLLCSLFTAAGAREVWARRVAFFSALLFAVHPVQTQAVTYIVQRMESLSGLFYILALLFFVRASTASTALKRTALYSGTVAAYVLGFYSKESAVTMPAVMLLADIFFISGKNIRGVLSRLPLYAVLFALLAFFLFQTIKPLGGIEALVRSPAPAADSGGGAGAPAAQRNVQPVYEGPSAGFSQTAITPKEYLYTQFNVLVYYVALLAVPVNQNLDYDYPVARSLFKTPQVNAGTVLNLPPWPPVVSLFMLLCVTGLGVYLFLRSKGTSGAGIFVSFFIFWFFIILSPTSSFVPIIDVIYEHRLYLAALGPLTIFVICVDSLATRLLASRGRG
ncbi:MAG TPA: hypothetical protein VNK06_00070 [Thermodesulfobacteriota bacterium]|nr:hypothetical protein [Thermodesulfobacteriota bacterium]